jgi:hypothetical protein
MTRVVLSLPYSGNYSVIALVLAIIRAALMEANTSNGSSIDKVIHIYYEMLRLLFTQYKLSLPVIYKETFSFYHTSLLFLLFFFSMDYLLSPQTYTAFASHYDKCRAPTFFI